MNTNGHHDPIALIRGIETLRCWYVSTGGAAGTTFQLALGGKVPRQAPLKNPAHSDEYRHFEGEVGLLVWCAWRLDGPDEPVVSWNNHDADVALGLGKLVGAVVEAATVTAPAWDLKLRFSGDLTLSVFCDHVPPDPSFDGNWDLWLPHSAVYVGPGARCRMETRSDAVSAG